MFSTNLLRTSQHAANNAYSSAYASQEFDALPGKNVSKELGEQGAIGKKAAFLGHVRPFVHGRQTQCRNLLKDDLAIVIKQRPRQHVERFRTGTLRRIDCACNLFGRLP